MDVASPEEEGELDFDDGEQLGAKKCGFVHHFDLLISLQNRGPT